MKRVTRKQARTWLSPIRQCLQEMRSGYADAARGYAVTHLHDQDDYVRTDYCIAGFLGLINRLFPDISTKSLERIQKRLANGVLVVQNDIDGSMHELMETEDRLTKITVDQLKSAVLTEQIRIEMEGA